MGRKTRKSVEKLNLFLYDISMNEEKKNFNTILIPKRMSPDVVIAAFILKKFGEDIFPGVSSAEIETVEALPGGKEGWILEDEGILSIYFKDASFPRGMGFSFSRLVANKLKLGYHYSIERFIQIAEKRGRGSVNTLIKNMIRQQKERPHRIYRSCVPILEAQLSSYEAEIKKLPEQYTHAFEEGKVEAFMMQLPEKEIRTVVIESNEDAMPHFLYTHQDIAAELVVQKKLTGHIRIASYTKVGLDFSDLAAIIRSEEARKAERELPDVNVNDMRVKGTMAQVPEWFFDPQIPLLETGRENNELKSRLDLDELKNSIYLGLEASDQSLPEDFPKTKKEYFDLFLKSHAEKESEEIEAKKQELLEALQQNVFELDEDKIVYI